MSVKTIFPKNNDIYGVSPENIIILVNNQKSPDSKNIWKVQSINWTITNIINSYIITHLFLHQNYQQCGMVNLDTGGDNEQYIIDIDTLGADKYEVRVNITFKNILNPDKLIENYDIVSFTIDDNMLIKNQLISVKNREATCTYTTCVIFEEKK